MTTPEQFLTDFCKDIVKTTAMNGDPMHRQTLVKGYTSHLEAMLVQAGKSGYSRATEGCHDEEREAEEKRSAYNEPSA